MKEKYCTAGKINRQLHIFITGFTVTKTNPQSLNSNALVINTVSNADGYAFKQKSVANLPFLN